MTMPRILYCLPECAGKSFRPSNGTEGMIFEDAFCARCIHEKFMHTQIHGDLQCDILNRAFLFDQKNDEYPEEWQYDKEGWPVCSAWKKWDWGTDDDGNFNDPPPIYPDDPNQLCLPFIFDELGISKMEKELVW